MASDRGSVSDLDARFDDDYLYFYETVQTAERNDQETSLIIRMLDVTPGMTVLDVPCGNGRIANRLAAAGCRVTGLDASPLFLERARQDAAARDVTVKFIEGDMRELPWSGEFDRVVCWFTSFGYFDDATDRQVLAGFHRALRPGGRLIIDHVNLTALVRQLPTGGRPAMGTFSDLGSDLLLMRTNYAPNTGRIEYERLAFRDGQLRRHAFTVRGFTFPELRDWLLDAGFTSVDVCARDGGPLTLDQPSMLVVAHA